MDLCKTSFKSYLVTEISSAEAGVKLIVVCCGLVSWRPLSPEHLSGSIVVSGSVSSSEGYYKSLLMHSIDSKDGVIIKLLTFVLL
jgi:hypothetical protein